MSILTDEQKQAFAKNGYLLLENFFDTADEIEPIQYGIYEIIGLVGDKYGVEVDRPGFSPENFDAGFMDLVRFDRKLASIVYDAVKQLTPFVRLSGSLRCETVFGEIRGTSVNGVAGAGAGIRIDIPGEEKYRAAWHQEYPGQFRSLDGIVFWSPLRQVTQDLGPVQIAVGSQVEGLIKIYEESEADLGRTGAYALRLVNEEEILEKYDVIAPLTKPGDLLIMDFCTVHASGYNVSPYPRMSMQIRHYSFTDPTGREIDWAGSFRSGRTIDEIHPGLLVRSAK